MKTLTRKAIDKPSASKLVREGDRFRTVGDWTRAEQSYRRATEVDSKNLGAWTDLGCLLTDGRRFSEAVVCFRKVAKNGVPATDDAQEALGLLAKIAEFRPDWARGQFSLGCAYEHLQERDRARHHLANALRLDSARLAAVEALYARMFWTEENWADAVQAADRALQANPNYYLALVVRGRACASLSRMPEAVQSLRRAIEMVPEADIHSSLLFDMNYLPETTPEILYAEACRWNALYAAPLACEIQPHTNVPDPERRLKIGYVSPDLYSHAIAKSLMPVFEHRERSRYEVYAYAVGLKSDDMTEWFRSHVDHFVSLPPDGSALAQRVRTDEIDVLVDLAGHTTGSGYLAFARKPAPVQVSWLGALSTTGMSAMDYFLGDSEMPCPGTEHLFSEKVYRLARGVCCYRATSRSPVAEAPYLKNGYITFGCFNSPRKITREVVRLWSASLHLVTNSRMLLKYYSLEEEARQASLRAWFTEDGIERERILFAGASPPGEYMEAYGSIDIALDPFPYNGGSTTLDALFMGVPVVTLAGRLPVQRVGASVLMAIGLPDLVTHSPEQYVTTAAFLARTVPMMPGSRQNLRKALESSSLMDEIGLVRSAENAFRDMWRTWCGSRG